MKKEHATAADLSQEEIAKRAYLLWQQNGCPERRDLEFWTKAEAELKSHRSQTSNDPAWQQPTRRDAMRSQPGTSLKAATTSDILPDRRTP